MAKGTQIFLNVSLSVIGTIALPGAWPFLLSKRQSTTWCARNLIAMLGKGVITDVTALTSLTYSKHLSPVTWTTDLTFIW